MELASFSPHSHDLTATPALCLAQCALRCGGLHSRPLANQSIHSGSVVPQAAAGGATATINHAGSWARRPAAVSMGRTFSVVIFRVWIGMTSCAVV